MTTEQQESQNQTTDSAVDDVNVLDDPNPFNAADQQPQNEETNGEAEEVNETPEEGSLLSEAANSDETAEVSDAEETGEGEADDSDNPIEYDLKLPENSFIDESTLAEVKEFAEANKLSSEAAQQIIDRENRAVEQSLQELHAQMDIQRESDRVALNAHPELGGKNLAETDRLTEAALRTFDKTGELKAFIKEGKNEFHPVIVGFLTEIGRAMSPDTLHLGNSRGSTGANSPQEIADLLFANALPQN